MNSVCLIGNMTADPEIKYTGSGKAVATISIAVNKNYTKNGERVQEVSFFQVEIWGATAENVGKYTMKGSKIAVLGELKQDRWETSEGQNRSRIKVIANRVEFLTPRNSTNSANYDDDPQGWDE